MDTQVTMIQGSPFAKKHKRASSVALGGLSEPAGTVIQPYPFCFVL